MNQNFLLSVDLGVRDLDRHRKQAPDERYAL